VQYIVVPDTPDEKVDWGIALSRTVDCLAELARRRAALHATAAAMGGKDKDKDEDDLGGEEDDEHEAGHEGHHVTPEEELTGANAYIGTRKMGYLMKCTTTSVGIKSWSKRLFILKNGFLLSFTPKDSEIYPGTQPPHSTSRFRSCRPRRSIVALETRRSVGLCLQRSWCRCAGRRCTRRSR
jgi:hypothetical protein